jgi:poly(A) polymerase Pap1
VTFASVLAEIGSNLTVDALELVAAGVMFGLALRALTMWMHDRLKPQ